MHCVRENRRSHCKQSMDGCASFLLNLGPDSVADLSEMASSMDAPGRKGPFCIIAEQSTAVSFSRTSAAYGDGLSDEGVCANPHASLFPEHALTLPGGYHH